MSENEDEMVLSIAKKLVNITKKQLGIAISTVLMKALGRNVEKLFCLFRQLLYQFDAKMVNTPYQIVKLQI